MGILIRMYYCGLGGALPCFNMGKSRPLTVEQTRFAGEANPRTMARDKFNATVIYYRYIREGPKIGSLQRSQKQYIVKESLRDMFFKEIQKIVVEKPFSLKTHGHRGYIERRIKVQDPGGNKLQYRGWTG